MLNIVMLFLTALALKQGYALKCYDCSQLNNANCGPSLTALFEQEECSGMEDRAVSCGTITDFGITARTCVPSDICGFMDQNVEHCSVCNTDGCNGYSTNETDPTEESTESETSVAVESTTSGASYLKNIQYITAISLILITLLNSRHGNV